MGNSIYLERKLKEIERYEKKTKRKQVVSLIMGILVMIPVTALAVILGKYYFLYKIAASIGFFDAMLLSGIRIGYNSRKHILEQLNQEKRHLKNIRIKGINSTKSLDQKRLDRIRKLQDEQEKLNDDGMVTGMLATVTGISTGLGALGIILNPLVGGTIATISFLATNLLANTDLKGEKSYNNLEARINNLKNDIELGSIYGRDINETNTNKTRNQASDSTKKVKKQYKVTKEQEKAIEDYLSYLSRMKSNETSKVKRK